MRHPLMCGMRTFSMSKIDEIGQVNASCMKPSMEKGAKSLRKTARNDAEVPELLEKIGKGACGPPRSHMRDPSILMRDLSTPICC